MKLPKNIRKTSLFGRMTLTKGQETALDALWSKAVKARAGNRCEVCLTVFTLQSHHVIGRRNKAVRHVVSNGCSLCAKHHMFAEQNGVAFAEWILKSRGQEWWNQLQAKSCAIKVFKEYTVIKQYLEAFL